MGATMDGGVAVIAIVCALASYLVCGVPFGLILGEVLGHKDIRRAGSGNIGTTNALRVAGPKVAALTLLLDVMKGVVCVNLSRMVLGGRALGALPDWDPAASPIAPGAPFGWAVALVALACLYGHIFSPYLKFHGGKGIATGVGILFGFYWPLALVHLAIFIVLVAITRYVSVGSIATAAVVPITMWVAFPGITPIELGIWALLGWTVVWAHRGNIARLRAGTESKLSFSKRTSTMDKDA